MTTQRRRIRHLLPNRPTRWPRLKPSTPPLFEEVGPSVTAEDITLWMTTIGRHISPLRAAAYVIAYDVAGKIAAAKLAGLWPPEV